MLKTIKAFWAALITLFMPTTRMVDDQIDSMKGKVLDLAAQARGVANTAYNNREKSTAEAQKWVDKANAFNMQGMINNDLAGLLEDAAWFSGPDLNTVDPCDCDECDPEGPKHGMMPADLYEPNMKLNGPADFVVHPAPVIDCSDCPCGDCPVCASCPDSECNTYKE